jgi:signal transduction histidine kinase
LVPPIEANAIHNLLVIDDEPEIVKALRRQFRRTYNVFTASSAEEGYNVLGSTTIHAIISDQRMPGMNGAEFFSQVRHEYPDAIRLLLTGYADIQAVIAAINDGNVFRYITKPWDPVELDTIVREAFERHDLMIRNRRLIQQLEAANASLEARVQERTQELAAANEQLRMVNVQKDAFLGMAAHDLRGPLTNIQICADLLRRTNIPEQDRDLLFTIIDETTHKMRLLITDILDINAIESGRLELNIAAVDVSSLIERVRHLNIHVGAQKGIQLVTQVSPTAQAGTFDSKRIEQVLDNLLSNAFKFSHPGTTVTLTVTRVAEGLRFSIQDQGQGIQPEDLPKLFVPFQKTATLPTAGEQSTGLGLAICKRIIEAHGGQIDVASQPGQGTMFTFNLPQPER